MKEMILKIGKIGSLKLHRFIMRIIGKYILRIILFLILISSILYLHFEKLKNFLFNKSNSEFYNYFCYNRWYYLHLRQTFLLKNEFNWLNKLINSKQPSKLSVKSPSLLKYLDTFLKEHSGKFIFLSNGNEINHGKSRRKIN